MKFVLTIALGYESLKFPPISVCRLDGSVFETYINWNNIPNKDHVQYVKTQIKLHCQTLVLCKVVTGEEAEALLPTFTDLTGFDDEEGQVSWFRGEVGF